MDETVPVAREVVEEAILLIDDLLMEESALLPAEITRLQWLLAELTIALGPRRD